ncbi:Hypothetical protein R9X50_00712600 [Acrodontium crateriforme]|uniref:Uncharacterized protein n=1 Tax=Acrodontium crateriforme TaxID=150365 RepID=A0AAQ3MB00_9PEZI|nr:Hypothetical protein R9X50_00712600 [Acrodontium crateriforme]
MATPLAFVRFVHTVQVGLCLLGATQSYSAITKLQKYESVSKKLAEWSKEAEFQLYKTQTTHSTGVFTLVACIAAAIGLAVYGPIMPAWARYCGNPAMLLVTLFARGHIANFWAPKDGKTVGMKIPLPNMGEYNKAQKATEELLQTLQWIEHSWLLTAFVSGTLGYSQ